MATSKRADADYQQEVREFVQSEVNDNVTSLVMDRDYWFEDFQNLYDSETDRHVEIYECWSVSSLLYRKLKDRGEPVADLGSCKVWGRTTTGQAIFLDHVICEIYDELQV